MKTTIEINDALLDDVRALAHREGCTLRSLLKEGLHEVLRSRMSQRTFHLRDASVPGNLTDEALAMSRQEILDLSPGDRS